MNVGAIDGMPDPKAYPGYPTSASFWYTNYTMLPGDVKPTIPDQPAANESGSLRTYQNWNLHKVYPQAPDEPIDLYANHPWRAPGRAPIWSPCGVAGGNPDGCPRGNPTTHAPSGNPCNVAETCGCGGGGFARGPDAREFPFKDKVVTT